MRIEHKVIVFSIILGLVVWIIDALLDYLFFYEESFLGLLIFNIPIFELYLRSIWMIFFLAFGIIMSRVIGKRIQIEKALSESEERYRKLIELSPDAIAVHSEGKIVFVNTAGAKLLGAADPSQLIGRDVLSITHPDYREIVKERVRQMVEEGKTVALIEEKFIRLDGSVIDVEAAAMPFTYQGKPAVQVVIRDITERKRAEEALRKAYDELEMRIQERTAELARSNAELEQFAYVASHDLQEPLRMISGFTQLLARRYKGKLDKDADEFIAYIVDGTTRMQRMIEDLLAYSRVGTRGKPFEPIDLEAALNQAIVNLKTAIEENDAVMTHDPLPTVMADATQIVQLFQNLIANAIKFRKKEEPPRIHVGVQQKGNEWIFSVQDNGIGISPEFTNRLFQLFQREHTESEYPGTGIGLAICKRIIERHGGRIWVQSQAGRGSTFYFTIPMRTDEKL